MDGHVYKYKQEYGGCSTAELSGICNFTALDYFSLITDNRFKDNASPIRRQPDYRVGNVNTIRVNCYTEII